MADAQGPTKSNFVVNRASQKNATGPHVGEEC